MTSLTDDERRDMVRSMLALSQEISSLVEQKSVDPGHLMRLMAAGIAQCLVAQAVSLDGGNLPDL